MQVRGVYPCHSCQGRLIALRVKNSICCQHRSLPSFHSLFLSLGVYAHVRIALLRTAEIGGKQRAVTQIHD